VSEDLTLSSVVIALLSPHRRTLFACRYNLYHKKPGAGAAAVREPDDKRPSFRHHLTIPAGSRAESGSVGTAHSVASRYAFRAALLLICTLVGVYAWFAIRMYQARRFSATHDQASLQRSIRLQPQDASNYDLLGQYFMWAAQDPQAAALEFQQAVRLNPYASSYWLHLAQSEYSLGNDGEQASAIRKAITVDPTTPEVAWAAANFFLVQGKTHEALDQFAVVVRNDPLMADKALEMSWRAMGEADPIVRRLPPDPEIYLKFIKLLAVKQQWAVAGNVWTSMLRLNREFDLRSALFYVDGLLANKDVAGARNVWQQIADRSSSLKPYLTADNLVVNGSFDREFLNAAFDWRYSERPGAAVTLDSTETQQGAEALSVTYSGSNEDVGISQYVPVTPNTSYVASAWVKSEELQSANGPRLRVYDGYRNLEYAQSEETLGTTSWHRVQTAFTVGKDTTLVSIRFSREPGSTIIRGRFWIDNVQMLQNVGESDRSAP
jgi:cytochrome c-type biogenesis protein CcmH/NrfG